MPVYDLLGIGFGPSNLALAIALEEHNRQAPGTRALTAAFFEKQQRFGWHRGMLIDGASMQVSFLKDLVTLRNPSSGFSFLSYLHSQGRLIDFINHKTFFPSRVEFHDYLEWAASSFEHLVAYGCEVIEVKPVRENGAVVCFDVVARCGEDPAVLLVRRARNLVFALGLEPRIPPGVTLSERIWHNHDLLTRLECLPSASLQRVAVVGAGQSAAEVTEYLHRRFPNAQVCAIFSRYGYTPADDSSFANRIFDPEAVDVFFTSPDDVRQMLLDYHSSTNYSAVDRDLIDELYRRVYQEKVHGEQRLRILNASRAADVQSSATGVRITVEFLPTGEMTVLDCDVLVYATGYHPTDPLAFLDRETNSLCLRDHQRRLRIGRDYRVSTSTDVHCGIYVQGATEHTHGISSSLLSNIAIRAGDILESITHHPQPVPLPHHPYALTADG